MKRDFEARGAPGGPPVRQRAATQQGESAPNSPRIKDPRPCLPSESRKLSRQEGKRMGCDPESPHRYARTVSRRSRIHSSAVLKSLRLIPYPLTEPLISH